MINLSTRVPPRGTVLPKYKPLPITPPPPPPGPGPHDTLAPTNGVAITQGNTHTGVTTTATAGEGQATGTGGLYGSAGIVVDEAAPTKINIDRFWGDGDGDLEYANSPGVDSPHDFKYWSEDFSAIGATESEIRDMRELDRQRRTQLRVDLTPEEATVAKGKNQTPNQYRCYLEILKLRAGAYDAPTPAQLPTVPLPVPRPVVRPPVPKSSPMNAAMIAVGAGLVIYLISKLV